MIWSFQCIGKPEAVVQAIREYGDNLSGQSKVEYDDALPHLIGLVAQNFASSSDYSTPVISFKASGSGSSRGTGDDLKQLQRSCQVSIEPLWAKLV